MLQVVMSVIYVFDVSSYPFTHIPLYFLTILYLASILEIYGMFKLGRSLIRKYAQLRRHGANLAIFSCGIP